MTRDKRRVVSCERGNFVREEGRKDKDKRHSRRKVSTEIEVVGVCVGTT